MPPGSHANPEQARPGPARRVLTRLRGRVAGPGTGTGTGSGTQAPRRRTAWSIGTPVMVLLSGALFVASAENSDGTDLRPGRYTDLASLVRNESREVGRLQDRVARLTDEVEVLTERVQDRGVSRYRQRIERLSDPAGLEPVHGEGVTVTLDDTDPEVVEAADEDVNINLFVVHQQDIQAVVNAMWKGGAEAVTVQGKRIISTTGIKCIGNSVTLQGRPYSPPYVIRGVGDQDELLQTIEEDDALDEYRAQAAMPDIAIGWELETEEQLTAPAYDGLLDLSYAEPIR